MIVQSTDRAGRVPRNGEWWGVEIVQRVYKIIVDHDSTARNNIQTLGGEKVATCAPQLHNGAPRYGQAELDRPQSKHLWM